MLLFLLVCKLYLYLRVVIRVYYRYLNSVIISIILGDVESKFINRYGICDLVIDD